MSRGMKIFWNDFAAKRGSRATMMTIIVSLVESEADGEGGVNTGPSPDEKNGDCGNESEEPVPAVGVHQNIYVGHHDSGIRNVDTNALVVVDVLS